MDIVSTGVAISPSVEVWQSAQGALEVVLMDTVGTVEATSQDHVVCHLYRTRVPVNVMIMNLPPNNKCHCIYLLCIKLQIKRWRGAAAGVCQELSGLAAVVTSHQDEARR